MRAVLLCFVAPLCCYAVLPCCAACFRLFALLLCFAASRCCYALPLVASFLGAVAQTQGARICIATHRCIARTHQGRLRRSPLYRQDLARARWNSAAHQILRKISTSFSVTWRRSRSSTQVKAARIQGSMPMMSKLLSCGTASVR